MRASVEWRGWRAEKRLQIWSAGVASEAVSTQCSRCVGGGKERDLIKNPTRITYEINGHAIGFCRLDQSPILLKHLHDLDPEVATLYRQMLSHRKFLSATVLFIHAWQHIVLARYPSRSALAENTEADKDGRNAKQPEDHKTPELVAIEIDESKFCNEQE